MEKYSRKVLGRRSPLEKALRLWRNLVEIATNGRRRLRMAGEPMKQYQVEEAKPGQDNNAVEEINDGSPNQSEYHSCTDFELTITVGSPNQSEYSSCTDFEPSDGGNNEVLNVISPRSAVSYKKVTLKWCFVLANFICEVLSITFEQLSSPHNSRFALICMLTSLIAVIICIIDIAYRGRQQKVEWKKMGKICWFYHPAPSNKCFCNLQDIFGLNCAVLQVITATISYQFYRQHHDNPIKISLCSVLFAFCLLCSKFSNNCGNVAYRDQMFHDISYRQIV